MHIPLLISGIVSASLVGLMSATPCAAADEPAQTLAPDEAFIAMKASGVHRKAIFEHVGGLDSFTVHSIEGPNAYKVKAGLYYLKTLEPLPSNFRAVEFPKPASTRSTFTVIAGSLTYIGDWSFEWTDQDTVSADYKIGPETIERIRARAPFAELPLFVAQIGQSPVRVNAPNESRPTQP